MSNNINNKYADTITILPITSKTSKIYPFEIEVNAGEGNLKTNSKIKANQVRTIDKKRLIQKIGSISKSKMKKVEKALLIHFDIL